MKFFFKLPKTKVQNQMPLQANSTKHTKNNIDPSKLFQKTKEEGRLPKAFHGDTNPDTTTSGSISESRSAMSDSANPWTIQSMEFSRPEY